MPHAGTDGPQRRRWHKGNPGTPIQYGAALFVATHTRHPLRTQHMWQFKFPATGQQGRQEKRRTTIGRKGGLEGASVEKSSAVAQEWG